MDIGTVKDLAAIAAPFTTLLANTFLKPKLERLAEEQEVDGALLEHGLVDKFAAYLSRSYEKHSYLRTVVFQNNKRRLSDLYVPLTVRQSNKSAGVLVDCFPQQLLPEHKKVLLVDTAGMGKSTISRVIFLKAIEENAGIPVFVELRQLKRGTAILDLIHNQVSEIDEIFDKKLLLKLLRRGDFILLFDGFDEIAISEREYATGHLHEFITKTSGNSFLITSRQDPALASFPDFTQFFIEPLRRKQAYELLRKYDPTDKIAASLIAKLDEERKDLRLRTFLANPLLVSLLFKAYDFKPTLPLRPDAFYRQVYEALFENHDLAKGDSFIREKVTGLNLDDFARVLRVLGMRTMAIGRVEYTADELSGHLREARERCAGLNFAEHDFIKDLTRTVPLFVQDGPTYRWSHKSFQEYFAALYIATDAKGDAARALTTLAESRDRQRFTNLFELYYDIDQPTFQRALTKKLIKEFLEYLPSAYSRIDSSRARTQDIQFRKLACFGRKYVLFPQSVVEKFESAEKGDSLSSVHGALQRFCETEGLRDDAEVYSGSVHYVRRGAVLVLGQSALVILQVLENRADPLVISLRSSQLRRAPKSRAASIREDISMIPGKKVIVVDDDPTNPLNAKAKFDWVNGLIANSPYAYSLDEAGCRRTLVDIERAEKQDVVRDFLSMLT